MSISTGTLNLKFMQRGTPLKGSPSGPSTPTPSTPGTPVPAPSKFIPTDRDSEWRLPASKLKNLRVPALVSTPFKLKGRITYETSYLPFLERGEASGSSSGRARDEMEISGEENDEDEDEDEDDDEDDVGSTRMVKGRMVFGQATKPEKTHFSDDEEEDSKETARHSLRGKGNKAVPPPSTPASKSKSTRTKATPNPSTASSSTPNRSQTQPQTPLPKPNKAGFLRPAGFEDMPSTPNASSTPTTTTSSKKNKKKRKSTQVDDAPVAEADVKSTPAGAKSGPPDVEEEDLAQGARKKRRQKKTKVGREEDKASVAEPPAVPESSKGKSKKNKTKQVEMEENDDEAEFDDFMDELIGEIERGE